MPLAGHTQDEREPKEPRRLSLKRMTAYAGFAALVCVLACLLFPGLVINPFVEGRITRAFGGAYPGHAIRISGLNYNIWTNRLGCDSIIVTDADSVAVFHASLVAVTGIDRLPLLLGGGITPEGLGGTRAVAKDVALTFTRSQHRLRCASLNVSGPDSSLTIEGLSYEPPAGDARFFAGSEFRRTRYRLVVPQIRVAGLAWVMPGNGCRAGAVHVANASLSVLIDKEKPVNDKGGIPVMPAEMLRSLPWPIHIDSLLFVDGRLVYQERFDAGSDPAAMTFDGIQATAEGIGNRVGLDDTAVVNARATLMGGGAMSVRMSIPLASPVFSFRFSGSLGEMEFSRLNPFVEGSEGFRIKTGILHSAAFDIDVADGKASGAVRAAYEDLKLVAIDSRTGSEADVIDTFVSLLANNVKLRTTNMPDESGTLKAGAVGYDRAGDETFLEFAWFALRSGIGDVAGF